MRLTIKAKLVGAFAFIILMLIGTAGYGIMSLSAFNDTISNVLEGPVARLELTQQVNISQLQVVRQQKNLLAAQSDEDAKAALAAGDVARKQLADTFAALDKIATEESRTRWDAVEAVAAKFIQADDQIRQLLKAGDKEGANNISVTDARKAANDIGNALDGLLATEKQKMKEADDGADVQYAGSRLTMLVAAGVALLIAAATAFWIANTISKGLTRANTVVREVSEGDLTKTAEITNHDEIGELLGNVNVMI
ncbi:MCP four helix bundle domain-containing protein, partial [Rhizobium leucaenae]